MQDKSGQASSDEDTLRNALESGGVPRFKEMTETLNYERIKTSGDFLLVKILNFFFASETYQCWIGRDQSTKQLTGPKAYLVFQRGQKAPILKYETTDHWPENDHRESVEL